MHLRASSEWMRQTLYYYKVSAFGFVDGSDEKNKTKKNHKAHIQAVLIFAG